MRSRTDDGRAAERREHAGLFARRLFDAELRHPGDHASRQQLRSRTARWRIIRADGRREDEEAETSAGLHGNRALTGAAETVTFGGDWLQQTEVEFEPPDRPGLDRSLKQKLQPELDLAAYGLRSHQSAERRIADGQRG
jgi:hypothetical protein